MRSRVCLVLLLVALAGAGMLPVCVGAQGGVPRRLDVFVEQDPETGTASIYFVDTLSGLSTVVDASSGTRFTLVGDYVLYERRYSGVVMRAAPDGTQQPHPFIRRDIGFQAVRWVVSPDGRAIAWVQVDMAGRSEAYVAWADGSDWRQMPISSPEPPLELYPVWLTNGMTAFFYDVAYRAEPARTNPYPTYRHLTEYSILGEAFYDLPQEPNCLCSAAFTPDGRIFARLEAEDGEGPFALRVWDVPSDANIRIPAPELFFPLAGDLILNDKGTFAAYNVASASGADADPQYALVVVDMVAEQQTLPLDPGPVRYRPVAFIDEDSALLLTGVTTNGTYKLNLTSGEFQRVADLSYLGTITTTP
jgi:hypothetical protein